MKKNCIIIAFQSKKTFNSQGNIKANKKNGFMGPLIYVLPRAPKGLKTALNVTISRAVGLSRRKRLEQKGQSSNRPLEQQGVEKSGIEK